MKSTLITVLMLCTTTAFCQNVGIGTETPSEKLEVTGNVRAGEVMLGVHPLYAPSVVGLWKNGFDYTLLTSSNNTYLNAASGTGFLELLVGNTSKVHIDGSTSRVGIGTILPNTHLEVAGAGFQQMRVTSTTNQIAALEMVNSTGLSWQMYAGTNVYTIGHSFNGLSFVSPDVDIDPSGTVLEPYNNNGFGLGRSAYRWRDVWATNGTIQTSDARLKKNILDLKYGLNSLMKLHPVTYNWKDGVDDRTRIGFLAQDVLAVIPEVVYQGDNSNNSKPEAKAGNGDAYGMNYSELIPVLVKAMQEQQKEIEALKQEIKRIKK